MKTLRFFAAGIVVFGITLGIFLLLHEPDQTDLPSSFEKSPPSPIAPTAAPESKVPDSPPIPLETPPPNPPRPSFSRTFPLSETDERDPELFDPPKRRDIGVAPTRLTDSRPFVKWAVSLGGNASGALVASGECVYAACHDRQLVTFQKDTGDVVFRKKLWASPVAIPALNGETLIVPQKDGHVMTFDKKTGECRWNYETGLDSAAGANAIRVYGAAATPRRIYVSTHGGDILFLDVASSNLSRVLSLSPNPLCGAPLLQDAYLFACDSAGQIHRCNTSGQKMGSFALPDGHATAMKIWDRQLVVATSGKTALARDAVSLNVSWSWPTAGWSFDGLAMENGVGYLAAGSLYAVRLADGAVLWEAPSPGKFGFCRGAPVVSGNLLYAAEEEGLLHKINRHTGRILKTFTLGAPIRCGIAASGPMVYVATTDKKLLAVDTAKE
ncbi:MAG: PQQ-binding-like beta-propeller repeat protein [Planctomycetota bacterium]